MTEAYVDVTIDAVSRIVPIHHEANFWAWLGYCRYAKAEGSLTPELAAEIRAHVRGLYAEYVAQLKPLCFH